MGYLPTLVIVAVALVALVVLVLAVLGPVRRLSVVWSALSEELRDKGGMLGARLAALRVRWAERRTVEGSEPSSAGV